MGAGIEVLGERLSIRMIYGLEQEEKDKRSYTMRRLLLLSNFRWHGAQ